MQIKTNDHLIFGREEVQGDEHQTSGISRNKATNMTNVKWKEEQGRESCERPCREETKHVEDRHYGEVVEVHVHVGWKEESGN